MKMENRAEIMDEAWDRGIEIARSVVHEPERIRKIDTSTVGDIQAAMWNVMDALPNANEIELNSVLTILVEACIISYYHALHVQERKHELSA